MGTLEIYSEYQEGLDGISVGQTIVVLFWLHKANEYGVCYWVPTSSKAGE